MIKWNWSKQQKNPANTDVYWVLPVLPMKQGKRDLNPRERFWRPQYCRCMIPLRLIQNESPSCIIAQFIYGMQQ